MDKMKFESPDMTAQNIERLAALFPNCITEMLDEEHSTPKKKVYKRAVNIEMLKQMLLPNVVDGDEAYAFTWVGKKAAIVEANKPIRKTLRPCVAESKNWDTTENLYIEGDNLEVLKLLQESYLGKIKMIYIDPPYNTGNDFIYADDFMRSQEEENAQMGMYDEDENRLFRNTDTNGRFHSDWCSMIYSRLMLARNLLTDDGVIFISIDDNEQSNLCKICDEVFGASNRIGPIVQNKQNAKNDTLNIQKNHEYILVYRKLIQQENGKVKANLIHSELVYRDVIQEGNRFYFLNDPITTRGEGGTLNARPNLGYTVYFNPISEDFMAISDYDTSLAKVENDENTVYCDRQDMLDRGYVKIRPPRVRGKLGCWTWALEKFNSEKDNIVITGKNGSYTVRKRTFVDANSVKTIDGKLVFASKRIGNSRSILDFSTNEGTNELNELIHGNLFNNPKNLYMLQYLVSLMNDMEMYILDFFSGSATTAHAVMQLNAEDGGHRKFIMVQLPEKCDESSEAYKAGYKNICEIGKERIRRAGVQILELSLENLEKEGIIEKFNTSKLSVPCSQNSKSENLEKEGVIEQYAGELSEIRSLEEVYRSCGTGLCSGQETPEGGNLRAFGSDAAGGGIDSVEHRGGAVTGKQGVYPVFESGKGITCGTGNTIVDMRTLELLNAHGYRIKFESLGRNQQNDLFPDKASWLENLRSKLSVLSSDRGFRVLKLDDTNMKDVYYAPEDYDQGMLEGLESNIKEDRTDLDLLFGCLLDWGLPLSLPYQSEKIDDCTVHIYNDGDLIACFDANIPESVVKEIARRKPLRAVFRDSGFASSPEKLNVFEIFKRYMPEDANDISKRIRVI